ncbi:MAG TPA: protein kinase [Solirubrobacteraceae bacterium]|nr:protein kinase [Solirubrobacteraceae bacterium]
MANYKIEALAGRGGMGVVYRARDLRLDRLVALKIVAPQYASDAIVRARLNREATLAASVNHPNTVPIYDAGEVDDTAYIATGWIDGISLHDLIAREGALEPERAVRLLSQVAGALEAAHEVGLIHRDVTPSNVIVDEDGVAYLTDFGLTRRATDPAGLTETHQLMATLDFVAPEQIEGEPVDRRADVYSLGCLAYFVLAGHPPYPRDGQAATIYAHLAGDYQPLSELRHDVPPDLDAAVRAAMARDPDDRPPTAAAFARMLRHAATDADPTAPGLAGVAFPPTETPPRRSRRRRGATLAAGVAAALALAASAYGVYTALQDHAAGTRTVAVARTAAAVSAATSGVDVGSGPSGTVVRLAESSGDRTRVIRVGAHADRVEQDAGRLYVAGGNRLTVLDPTAPASARRIALPGRVADLSVAGGTAWLTFRDRPTLLRVGAATTPILLPHPAAAVAAAGRAVWVADPADEALLHIDGATGVLLGRVHVRGRPTALAAAGRRLWVVDRQRSALLVLDARTGDVDGPPVPVAPTPRAVAADRREVWVVSAGRNVATRIDALTGRPMDEIGVPARPTGVALTQGAAWLVSAHGAVTRIPR